MNAHSPSSRSAPAIELQGLSLAYDGKPVLQGLDWRLAPGQVVGLLGRNGCGKTTLLEAALGLREPAAGSAMVFGCPVRQLDDATRARIGYVPQTSQLFEWMTADQMLRYFSAFYPRWNPAKVEDLLACWDIDRRQTIGKMSTGQRQLLSIIRALAHEPELLVLDEPVASLDPAHRRDFLQELVQQVSERGTTIVLSTHILSDLERVATDMVLLANGRLALQAPIDELLDDVSRVSGPSAEVLAWVRGQGLPLLAQQALGDGHLQVVTRRAGDTPLAAGLQAQPLNLEDLFLALAS